jgi:hypothetical protein
MRPRERRETGEQELFRSRLDQIIDMNHALVKLARGIVVAETAPNVSSRKCQSAGPTAVADAADGGPGDPQAHL